MIYMAWSGLWGDCGSYSAWLMAYDAGTLKQTSAIDLVPNNHGAGLWMGGGGPAADSAGNVYVISGNGFGDTPGTNSSYGNSFVRLTTSSGLKVGDYFTPFNTSSEDAGDADFGSAGPLLLPDLTDASNATQQLAVGAGKDGNLYVLNRSNLGQFNSAKNNIYQQIALSGNENFSSPVFFRCHRSDQGAVGQQPGRFQSGSLRRSRWSLHHTDGCQRTRLYRYRNNSRRLWPAPLMFLAAASSWHIFFTPSRSSGTSPLPLSQTPPAIPSALHPSTH